VRYPRRHVVEQVQALTLHDQDRTVRDTGIQAEGDGAMTSIRTAPTRIAARDTRRVKPPAKVPAPIYSTPQYKQWRKQVIMRAGGRCQDPQCLHPTRRPSRLFADHIVELRDNGAPFDPANGMVRCGSCHTRKTADARARRMGLR
jgi:5-methylcytosine-specific restriction protein A